MIGLTLDCLHFAIRICRLLGMDLNLEIRTKGRTPALDTAEAVRPLVEADLALLEVERATPAPALKRLRDSHHALARVLALGAKPAEASIITGYSASRISILQADPSFQELVSHYRGNSATAVADLQERMLTLSLDALEELRDRLNDNPELISNAMLLEVLKTGADRTGYGPKSTQVNVNVNLAARMGAARQRIGSVTSLEQLPAPTDPTTEEAVD